MTRLTDLQATLALHELLLPDRIYIAPSKIDPWRGVRQDGQLFTDQQLRELRSAGMDPETVEFVTLRDCATRREMWWGQGSRQPVFVLPCPVIERLSDDAIRVLTPYGAREVVRGTEVRRPKR